MDVASNFNSTAPLFTQHAQQQFQTNGALQLNLIRSLHRMLTFYGLQLTYDPVDLTTTVVRPASNFAQRAAVWLTPSNHNFLRLTRILSSLRLAGLQTYAEALMQALAQINGVDSATLQYWYSATWE